MQVAGLREQLERERQRRGELDHQLSELDRRLRRLFLLVEREKPWKNHGKPMAKRRFWKENKAKWSRESLKEGAQEMQKLSSSLEEHRSLVRGLRLDLEKARRELMDEQKRSNSLEIETAAAKKEPLKALRRYIRVYRMRCNIYKGNILPIKVI